MLLLLLIALPVMQAAASSAGLDFFPDSIPEESDAPGLDLVVVNIRDRQASQQFFEEHYLASQRGPQVWNGNTQTCHPGTPDPDFDAAVLQRINYYRLMAGLAPVKLSDEYSRKARQAALMTTLNGLSHRPATTARCYSLDGAQAAAHSHLYLGRYGPAAVDGYIQDHDEGFNDNYHVGHRRWLLLPQLEVIGNGDIPGTETLHPANAIWIVDKSVHALRPETREPFVAWPPPGHVPYSVVYPRWSFSYAGADFSRAAVYMTHKGEEIPVQVEALYEWKPTEPTLVWVPLGMDSWDDWPRPDHDTTYTVTLTNIYVDGRWLTFSYEVTVFDPMAPVSIEPAPTPVPAPRLLHYRPSLLQ